jgi:uncharacterized protein (TIGR03435 family)
MAIAVGLIAPAFAQVTAFGGLRLKRAGGHLSSAPAWVTDRRYRRKKEAGGEMTSAELMTPMQALLKERFALRCHWETRPHEL